MTKESARQELLRLMAGFRRFREKFFEGDASLFQRLAVSGQSPKTLMIACSDSRVDPAILSSALPGELFVVRNVANLVPPFESNGGFHGVSAAIEFAVVNLKVENVVVLGHRQCGGIRSLFAPEIVEQEGFVQQWMKIAEGARARVQARHPGAGLDELCRECEQESIVTSLKNLETFPFVREAQTSRGLSLVGVYFDLEAGVLLQYEEEHGAFRELNLS